MTTIFRRDPGVAILLLALWAGLLGASLVLPGDAFASNPIYAEFVRLHVSETWCGAGAITDALLLAVTTEWGSSGWRALVAVASAPLWFAFGALMLIGAASAGALSGGGAFTVLGSLFLAAAGAQWPHALSLVPMMREDEPWT